MSNVKVDNPAYVFIEEVTMPKSSFDEIIKDQERLDFMQSSGYKLEHHPKTVEWFLVDDNWANVKGFGRTPREAIDAAMAKGK